MRIAGAKSAELTSSKKSKRRQHKTASTPTTTVLQRLVETCREVFANGGPGFIPPPEDVDRIKAILDCMSLKDVGLRRDLPIFRNGDARRSPTITYFEIYKCPNFEISIFCLPASAVIPLHNHPNMTVFSKILSGSMHIQSYDWVDVLQNTNDMTGTTNDPPDHAYLAKLKTDSDFTAQSETSVLYPTDGGNIHCFTANTACAVLDVLGPPYSDPDGRHCAYYHEFPYDKYSGGPSPSPGVNEAFAWLKERPKPDDCIIVRGPKLVEI